MDNTLPLSVLQSFCGNLKDTNPEGLEGIWYAYWAEAYRTERRFDPKRVFTSPQYPLTKYQLSNDGELKDMKRVPDFLLLFVEGHRDSSRMTVNKHQVTDYTQMLACYMGNCVVDQHAVLAVCEIKAPPTVRDEDLKVSESFQEGFHRKMEQAEGLAHTGAKRQLTLYFSALEDEGKHVKGVAAIAAVGPFFSVANCEEDQIDTLSNFTDSSFRSSDISDPSSSHGTGMDKLYARREQVAHPPASPEPQRL